MLTGKQKKYLKSMAHSMSPIIQVGKNGINETLVQTVNDALEARELIKISVLQNCLIEVDEVAEALSTLTRSEQVQVIGRTIVLFRQSRTKRQIELPR